MSALGARAPMPPLWLATGLLLWGALTDNLAGAGMMAVMLESISLTRTRWSLGMREFHRAADLTSIVFAVVAVLQFSRYSVHGIYQILAVTPYCFFPLVLAQRASTAQTIPLSALFHSMRRAARFEERIDIAPHYLAICLVAASTTARDGSWFIVAAAALVTGLLVADRPRRYRAWQWCAALGFAAGLALVTRSGVLHGQRVIESSMMYWFNQFPWSPGDPNSAVTAIGALGRLKLSDQIRVRVAPGRALKLPLFLQEASFDQFKFGSWTATAAPFAAIDKLAGRHAWTTAEPARSASAVLEFNFTHARELALLPVPRGARRVDSDEIAELQRNRFGTLMSESPPGALRYRVSGGEPASTEAPPTAADTTVPVEYLPVMRRINAEIGLDGLNAVARAARIQRFFLDRFKYSLVQQGRPGMRTPLAHFLTTTRRGHCEYFASATVLLLREAGIPARYAVGYVVENYSTMERAYIARARHAHAWALAHLDGEWRVVDSTPSVWYELEEDYASRWQSVQDLASWLWYRYQRLIRADWHDYTALLVWLVPPLAVVLYLRLRRSPLAVRERAAPSNGPTANDARSPMSPLLAALATAGLTPRRGETLKRFLERAAPTSAGGIERAELLLAYYRLRFGTHPADTAADRTLAERVARFSAALASH